MYIRLEDMGQQMTTVEAPVYGLRDQRYTCDHVPAAVCFLCSDQVPWWKEVRLRMGLGEEPPNAWRPQPRVSLHSFSCIDCGGITLGKRCKQCHVKYMRSLRRPKAAIDRRLPVAFSLRGPVREEASPEQLAHEDASLIVARWGR